MDRVQTIGANTLGYAEFGRPGDPPIFYFHGGMSSRLDIAFAETLCRPLNIRLIAVDRPGIGLSSPVLGYSVIEYARMIGELADALDIGRFGVLGWSAGGAYALASAFALGDRVAAIATAGGMAPVDRRGAVRELGMKADHFLFYGARYAPALTAILLKAAVPRTPNAAMKALLASMPSADDRAVIESQAVADATGFMFEAARQGTRGIVEDYRTLGMNWGFSLADIRQHVSIWQGEQDVLVPLRHAFMLRDEIPENTFSLVPGRGHFILHREFDTIVADLRDRL